MCSLFFVFRICLMVIGRGWLRKQEVNSLKDLDSNGLSSHIHDNVRILWFHSHSSTYYIYTLVANSNYINQNHLIENFLSFKMKMQKAWFYEEYGPKEVLKLGDLPIPSPLHNQLLVQVRAAALNPIDSKRRLRPIFPSKFPVSVWNSKSVHKIWLLITQFILSHSNIVRHFIR
jgi:hypothetical protein